MNDILIKDEAELSRADGRGLTAEQVAARVSEGKVNKTRIKAGKSSLGIVLDKLLTYFNLIYAIVTVVLIAIGSITSLGYLVVVLPNILIAIVQELRAKRTVERLQVTTDPRATVIRDGEECEIGTEEIVLGDLMRISLGRQVLADAIIVSGSCEANESMLTGESVPVKKEVGDRVLAGSFIVSGSAVAEVDRVGDDNYVAGLERSAKSFKAPSSNLFRDLDRLIKIIGIVLIPLAIGTFIVNWFVYSADWGNFETVKEVIEKTAGSIVGMIPAGMYLLVTLTLSVSVIKLGRRRTLVQDMYSIEMLASADVVCLDKTGTITDGTMEVTDIIPLDGSAVSEVERIMAYVQGVDEGVNATSAALSARFGKREATVIERIPFSSSRKYSAVELEGVGAFAIGAPRFAPADIDERAEGIIAERAARGERVLVLVRQTGVNDRGVAVALIAIADRIRPSAAATIAKFQESDVTVKVISGDHAATVSTIAKRVGIKNADKYLSCESISDEELVGAVDDYAVFGRVTPEQKVLLVRALKEKGHTVAMTGDGVNDTLALKEANCAIAMADGSEVARKVSQIVLLDSDFSTLPDVVKEGRRCINNVRQSASLFVMKTIFVILVTLFSIVTFTGYPFGTSNFIILELIIIGLASIALAFEPNEKRIEGSFIERVLINSLPSALAMFLPILVILIVGACGVEDIVADGFACRNSVAMCVTIMTGYINLLFICRPYTRWRSAVIGIVFAALAIIIPVGGLIDVKLLGSEMFNFPAAVKDPAFFFISMAVGVACAVLMQLLRRPLEALGGAISSAIAKRRDARGKAKTK